MRFVDRINYLFLELAECIALGYDPREEWLIEALRGAEGADGDIDSDKEAMDADPAPAPKPVIDDGEPCCGHPGNEQCCEEAPPAPPSVEGEQREKKQRRRPPRPRVPQTDDNIPVATPDRRLDPTVVAERARAKRQRDE
jgi:hypothetical protein